MTRRLAVQPLVRDVLIFARSRAVIVGVLLVAGSLLEVAGVLLLVPIVQILLGDPTNAGAFAGRLLAAAGATGQGAQIGAMLLIFLVLIAVRFVVLLMRDSEVARLRVDFVADVRERAFRALAALPWTELAGRARGRIGHALVRDVDRVSDTVGMVLTAGMALLQIAVQFAASLALAPVITLSVALLGAIAFFILRDLRARAARQGAALTEADFGLFSTATVYLGGLKSARAHGLEDQYATAFNAAARRVAAELLLQQRDYVLSRLTVQALVAVVGLAAVAAGVFVVPVAPERLIVVILILARLAGPVQMLQMAAQHVGYAAAAYHSVSELSGRFEARSHKPAAAPARPLDHAPAIRFHGVSFAASEAELLTGIDCEIAAGRTTVLTGPSGAGKSLFCDLAAGLITPQSGHIDLDGQPFDAAAVARLRASIAYVAQEPFVLEDTLRANLTWGCGKVGDDEIWRALEAVGATGLARDLAGGLDGSMRLGGGRFSGGERQRFRLANALLRRPAFLVLDEATNALDTHAETMVMTGIRAVASDATILIVTHRPSLLDLADVVLVLERGRLTWSGPSTTAGHPVSSGAQGAARGSMPT